MSNVFDFKLHKNIRYLEREIKNQTSMCKILKAAIKDLTKYEDYSSIKRELGNLHALYQDMKRDTNKNLGNLERLKNEQQAMVKD